MFFLVRFDTYGLKLVLRIRCLKLCFIALVVVNYYLDFWDSFGGFHMFGEVSRVRFSDLTNNDFLMLAFDLL